MKINRKTENQLKFLAWYQIIGGGLGILSSTYKLIVHASLVNSISLLWIIICCLLFSFSFFSGYQLYSEEYFSGLKWSKINQALQIISVSLFGYGFQYTAGLKLLAGFNLTYDIEYLYDISLSSFSFIIQDDNYTAFGFNLIAFVLFFMVILMEKELEDIYS